MVNTPAKVAVTLKEKPKSPVKDTSDFLSDPKIGKLLKKSPLFLDAEDEMHVSMFRKILELSLSQGRWSGAVPKVS